MILNNSRLKSYEACPRMFFYESILRLRSILRNEVLDEGIIMHDLWAAHYLGQSIEFIRAILKSCYDELREQAQYDIEVTEHNAREEYLWRLFTGYLAKYKDEELKVILVEDDFITPLGDSCRDCGFVYPESYIRGEEIVISCDCGADIHWIVGRADLLVERYSVEELWDHKTKRSSISEAYLEAFETSPQFTQYLYGMSRKLGRSIERGVANAAAMLKTVGTAKARGNPFQRNTDIVKTSIDFQEFVKDRLEVFDEININQTRMGPPGEGPIGNAHAFRKNTSNCFAYNRKCDFYNLCHPARTAWWTVPDSEVDNFEQKEDDYVTDYTKLIAEERNR